MLLAYCFIVLIAGKMPAYPVGFLLAFGVLLYCTYCGQDARVPSEGPCMYERVGTIGSIICNLGISDVNINSLFIIVYQIFAK